MIIKHEGLGKNGSLLVKFVYEFVGEKYFTSHTVILPEVAIPIRHGHPWLVIMREVQRCFSDNWSVLNVVLSWLHEYSIDPNKGSYPSKQEIVEYMKAILSEEEWENEAKPGWFFHPDDYDTDEMEVEVNDFYLITVQNQWSEKRYKRIKTHDYVIKVLKNEEFEALQEDGYEVYWIDLDEAPKKGQIHLDNGQIVNLAASGEDKALFVATAVMGYPIRDIIVE